VDSSAGIQASLEGRYAFALFELASEKKKLESVSAGLASLTSALAESEDFRALTQSPLIGRDAAGKAALALAKAMGVDPLVRDFLGVLARNGRLSRLGEVIDAYERLAARRRGETQAEIASARPLDDKQIDTIRAELKRRIGRDVTVSTRVDPDLLGGLVVKVGSTMIDGSIRTKLNNLAQAMKG